MEQRIFNKVEAVKFTAQYSDVILNPDGLIGKSYRVYHQDGFCFEVEIKIHCEPEEVDDNTEIEELKANGCTYHFYDRSEIFEGFKEITLNEALKIEL